MTAEFFALAFIAAINPKLLALDLLLLENRRPRAMFLCILAGGMSLAIAVGLVDVLVLQLNLVRSQKGLSAGVDLALGVLLLAVGGLLLTGRLPRRRAHATEKQAKEQQKGTAWAYRALREPRLGLAFGIGAVVGIPGASYLAAMGHLVEGNYATATRVVAVLVFVIIEFLLIIVPFALLELRPQATTALLRRSQAWFSGHAKQLVAGICVLLGAYLVISALVRLL